MSDDDTAAATTRRSFIDQALAATSALALAEALPAAAAAAAAPRAGAPAAAPTPTPTGLPAGIPPLATIGTIASRNGKLHFVMTVRSGPKLIPTGYAPDGTPQYLTKRAAGGKILYPMLRYFHGRGTLPGEEWPLPNAAAAVKPPPTPPAGGPPPTPAGPGPTLRCALGDNVEIALINHVNVADFGGTLDAGETGKATGCDTVKFIPGPGATADPNLGPGYPGNDPYPNCLHGSSSANIHFHGTHTTPSTTGDNVLVNVRPNLNVTAAQVAPWFDKIFAYTETMGHSPRNWHELPPEFQAQQKQQLVNYDRTAPWKGGRGLPRDEQLWLQNEDAIRNGVWPQWYSGAYPYSFKIPRYGAALDDNGKPVTMGQSPGTHWYHSHKHGSTAINSFNGLSGALIVADDSPSGYDGKLKAFYKPYGGYAEKVLVFQQLIDQPNLLKGATSAIAGPSPTLCNGQYTPKITMRTGEVQFWRMVNACARNTVSIQFVAMPGTTAPLPQYKQTAQDGVQLHPKTYASKLNGDPVNNLIVLAAANRADVLVQAPPAPGFYSMGTTGPDGAPQGVLYVEVVAAPAGAVQMPFPGESDFPKRPGFLDDLDSKNVRVRRTIDYGWLNDPPPLRTIADKASYGGNQPQFTINGAQFHDRTVNEVMLLGDTEEWLLINSTTKVSHPFHIHINPFQIYEIYDPTVYNPPGSGNPTPAPGGGLAGPTPTPPVLFNTTVVRPPQPYVWWDTFAIPAGIFLDVGSVIDPKNPPIDIRTGKPLVIPGILPGYVRMRTRFVDFAGMYVQHCHILAHEDRGMMQLLEVVNNRTFLRHH